MANEHPFQSLFETLGRAPTAHAESVNRQAYEILHEILSVPVEKPGRCILLRAPRAGHGKTHLLSRIQHHLGSSHEFIPLHASFGSRIDATSVIDDALRTLLRPLPAAGGLCVLDLVTRRLFAGALQPLVGSGEVPCQDREGALSALRTRPVETFDFHHPNAVTAHWARENFEVLGQRLSVEVAQRCDLPVREVGFWVEALFRFAATPVENSVRIRVLTEAVRADNPSEGVQIERLEALLGMLAQLTRVVLVGDDLEGFSSDESAALRLAAFIGNLRQSVDRLDVILSVNQDIWESAFVPRLSGGLADRLSEVVIELDPLTEGDMVDLLESRVPGLGERVLERIDRSPSCNHARGLIRAAGVAWLRASAMDSKTTAPTALTEASSRSVSGAEEKGEAAATADVAPVREFNELVESPPMENSDLQSEEPSPEPEPLLTQDEIIEPGVADPSPTPPIQTPTEESEPSETAFVPDHSEESLVFPPDLDPVPEVSDASASEEPLVDPGFTVEDEISVIPENEPERAIAPTLPVEADPDPEASAQFSPQLDPDADLQEPPNPVGEPEAEPDTDRVDDLLRQFRERYGRGSH